MLELIYVLLFFAILGLAWLIGKKVKDSDLTFAAMMIVFILYALFLIGFRYSTLSSGYPKLSLPYNGTYKVVHVHVSGDDVNLLLVDKQDKKDGEIRHFQLPKEIFWGGIKPNAKTLIVKEIGTKQTGKMTVLELQTETLVEASK